MSVPECPFCSAIAEGRLVLDGGPAIAIADAFPVSKGHTLVIPRRHEPDYFALSEEEHAAILSLVRGLRRVLADKHKPQGFNIGLNVGAAAGQTVLHAHVHVIPRYSGDVEDPRGGVRWVVPAKAPYWRRE